MKMMIIDSREKPKAIKSIVAEFDKQHIPHFTSKLFFGDYMDYNRPQIVVDRKQTIAELAKNCTVEQTRFKAELERAKAMDDMRQEIASIGLMVAEQIVEKEVEKTGQEAIVDEVINNARSTQWQN
jgi:4-aminobutyrate aminotransferase-like enzyme